MKDETTDIVNILRGVAERRIMLNVRGGGIPVSAHILARAADEIEKLRGLLKDCADELADQIEGRYAQTKDHPAMKLRYDRDMQPVLAAREALTGRKEGNR